MVVMVARCGVMAAKVLPVKVQAFLQFHGVTKQNMEDTLAAEAAAELEVMVPVMLAVPVVPVAEAMVAKVTITMLVHQEVIALVLALPIPAAAVVALDRVLINGNIPVEMVAQAS